MIEPPGRMGPLGGSGPDRLEQLLSRLGVKFGKQTVLFDVESDAIADQSLNPLASGAAVEVPAIDFEGKSGTGRPGLLRQATPETNHRLGESMRLAARSLGKDAEGKDRLLDLRWRNPRPIYFDAEGKAAGVEFARTSAASWNEDQPFPSRERKPQYQPPKANDPDRGTLDEKRRGPFPVAVALETTLPADWYTETKSEPAVVRVAVLGHGGFFTGPELSPAKEKLMLNTVNWLLGREEHLAHAENPEWQYPRVALAANDKWLWHWGTQLGLPLLFAYLGLVVLMVRRLR